MDTNRVATQQFSLEQAVRASPALAGLRERVRQSERCMQLVRHLLPATMRPHVTAGPIDETGWCLLVANTAASTKLRQLLPSLEQTLANAGMQVSSVRIKVQAKAR